MATINVGKLSFDKTYVCNEVGSDEIAKTIQFLSCKVYPALKPEYIPTHTFALRFVNNDWHVYENHLKWGGIKQYPLEEYLADTESISTLKDIIVQEYPLNLASMDYWLKYNPGYSVLNLAEIAEKRLIKLPLPDTKGWVCSQTIAAMNFDICVKMNIPFECITPVDWKVFFSRGMK